jgi:hypothetical protein
LAILFASVIGVFAYNVGFDRGLAQAGQVGEAVRYVGPWFGWWFFPFGLILFPLFLFGFFALVSAAFWRFGGAGRRQWGPGPWRGRLGTAEEWHRRLHEQEANPPQPPQTQA